jgi:hypothetical protein
MLREVKDPAARKQIKAAIGDLLKSVVDATKSSMGETPEVGAQVQQKQGEQKKG